MKKKCEHINDDDKSEHNVRKRLNEKKNKIRMWYMKKRKIKKKCTFINLKDEDYFLKLNECKISIWMTCQLNWSI